MIGDELLAQLQAFARDEQVMLWGELDEAIDHAVDRVWSMDAASASVRIINAARLVGPTAPDEVPFELVAGGVYAAVLVAGGLAVPAITPGELDGWHKLMPGVPHLGDLVMHYRKTVQMIASKRETAFLAGGHP